MPVSQGVPVQSIHNVHTPASTSHRTRQKPRQHPITTGVKEILKSQKHGTDWILRAAVYTVQVCLLTTHLTAIGYWSFPILPTVPRRLPETQNCASYPINLKFSITPAKYNITSLSLPLNNTSYNVEKEFDTHSRIGWGKTKFVSILSQMHFMGLLFKIRACFQNERLNRIREIVGLSLRWCAIQADSSTAHELKFASIMLVCDAAYSSLIAGCYYPSI